MKTYDLYMMAPDGGTVRDCTNKTEEEINNILDNMGSEWFFYPFPVIVSGITAHAIYGQLHNMRTGGNTLNRLLHGKRLKTIKKLFLNTCLIGDEPLDVEEKIINKLIR